jgi:chemosensory pili system protein ChpA (sensor histidine kinase/response regulator)
MQLLEIPEQTPSSEVDEEILEIFVEEVEEVLGEIVTNFNAWKNNQADSNSLAGLRRGFHTLKGSGRMVGATVIGELGWYFENLLNRVIEGTLSANDKMFGLIEQVDKVLPSMIEQFKLNLATPDEVRLLISQADYLAQSNGESLGEFELTPSDSEKDFPDLDNLESELGVDDRTDIGTLDWGDGDEIPDFSDIESGQFEDESFDAQGKEKEIETEVAISTTPANLEPVQENTTDAPDDDLLEIFFEEAEERLENTQSLLERWQASPDNLPLMEELQRELHSLKGGARMVGLTPLGDLSHHLEDLIKRIVDGKLETNQKLPALVQNSVDELASMLEEVRSGAVLKMPDTLIKQIKEELEPDSNAPKDRLEKAPELTPTNQGFMPDAPEEIVEIFLEESEERIENTQSLLERWQSSPNDLSLMEELQRELHSLKGGARMVGLTPIGDLSHDLEDLLKRLVEGKSQLNPKLPELVQNSVDELASMREAVVSGEPLLMPTALIAKIKRVLEPDNDKETSSPVTNEPITTKSEKTETQSEVHQKKADSESDEERIRVRASLIDQLTNLAGELSISRSQMEQQQGGFKNNMVEMEQTVVRLQELLRRVEIETETQIASHFGNLTEVMDQELDPDPENEEYDPLEFDRFSTMQQLSRSLMESASDLKNIQDSLKSMMRHSESLLIQQSRIGAELQNGIMRTRMVPFSKISARLQRIIRQTANKLGKQVKFIINGENLEFEKTVLDRIVAPLEHMLRNAIDHGIEDPQTRQKAGKDIEGKMIINLFKEGAELIIKIDDDGAGLNVSAIRNKAIQNGVIEANSVISDQELMELILKPGFSTAKKVTQVSGRGVGMDVVNSELKQLSGSLRISSRVGEGTTFEIRLPISLTITQALLIHTANEMMAVPMNHLDAVMRIERDKVIAKKADEVRYCEYMNNSYRVYHMGELLGFGQISSMATPLIHTLFVRTGDRRVALLVDGIEGGKEIVVKSVGPQIAAIPWIAGATILGDGQVVLILDLPSVLREETPIQYVPPKISDIIEPKETATTVMVVDDSITVRKVTARFLTRQGMKVLTAKDGLDAVEKLHDRLPDLMLLDIEMPRMDGYELATQIRNNPDWKHLPIIMITSRSTKKFRDKAEDIGVNRYLSKPYEEKDLLKNIKDLLDDTRASA